MNKKEALKLLKEYEERIAAFNLAFATMGYDQATIAPKKGILRANELQGVLSGEYYRVLVDKQYIEAIKYLDQVTLDQITRRKVDIYLKDIKDNEAIGEELFTKYSKLANEAFYYWEKAREVNDYQVFEPYLIELIEVKKEMCKLRNEQAEPYDLLLNDFTEGMGIEAFDQFFSEIKKELIPLIKKVTSDENRPNNDAVLGKFKESKQVKVMKFLTKYLKFDPSWGYMGVSTHPFTSGFTTNDVRITTAYDESNLQSSIFSVVHEIGHATYEHQVADKYDNTAIKYNISMAIHESQSRLFENNLGRSKSFWEFNYPKLQRVFKKELNDVTLDEFISAINYSECSLIRTEADELTYPIHVLIRYEIEKGIFDGSIDVKDLKEVWNNKYQEYLGISANDDLNGILQDSHWSSGAFGYFPSYALGSAFACQIYNKMAKDLDINELLRTNKFGQINKWLKDNIQKDAALKTPLESLEVCVEDDFNPKYYVEYLKEKFDR